MGTIKFIRKGGRIIPILERAARQPMALPEKFVQPIKNIRFAREARATTVTSDTSKFVQKHTTKFNNSIGKNVGMKIAKIVGKREKK
jgi:hypothetical protein